MTLVHQVKSTRATETSRDPTTVTAEPSPSPRTTAVGPTPLVLATDVLVAAITVSSATWKTWPATPPGSLNSAADCVGIVAEPGEWALWLSDDLLHAAVQTLLDRDEGLGWAPTEVRRYVTVLQEIADASGGGTVARTPSAIGRGAPLPLRAALDLAVATQAPVVVSDWLPLLRRHGWAPPGLGPVHILASSEFRRRVDAARRASRLVD